MKSPTLIKHPKKLLRYVLNLKKANKTKDPNNILRYKKHCNMVKLKNQSKQRHFDSLNPFLGSKLFGRAESRTFLTSLHLVTEKLN